MFSHSSAGDSNSWSACHLNFGFSQLACSRTAAAWGRRRFTRFRQYPPACLRLFGNWAGPACGPLHVKQRQTGVKNEETSRRGGKAVENMGKTPADLRQGPSYEADHVQPSIISSGFVMHCVYREFGGTAVIRRKKRVVVSPRGRISGVTLQ